MNKRQYKTLVDKLFQAVDDVLYIDTVEGNEVFIQILNRLHEYDPENPKARFRTIDETC